MRFLVAVFLSFSLGLQGGIYLAPLTFDWMRRTAGRPGQLIPLVQAQETSLPAKAGVPYREQTTASSGEHDQDAGAQDAIFEEMDRLNLEMAELQMEKKRQQVELENLQLEAQKEALRSQIQPDMTMVSRPTVRLDVPGSQAGRPQLKIISITAFGDEKSVSLDAGSGSQDFKAGDYIKADSNDKRRIEDIDPLEQLRYYFGRRESSRYCLN